MAVSKIRRYLSFKKRYTIIHLCVFLTTLLVFYWQYLIIILVKSGSLEKESSTIIENAVENIERKSVVRFKNESSWTCSGNMNYEYEWHYRICAFKNICYNKKKQIFQFYRRPGGIKKPVLFEPNLGHIYEFNVNNHGFVGLVARANSEESWGPTIVEDWLPPRDEVPFLNNVHALFMHWHVTFNPGHVIWEDIASAYYAMVRLNEYDRHAVLLEYRNFPKEGDEFYRMYQNLVPAFASNVNSLDRYVSNFSSSLVCFDTLVAGSDHPMFSMANEYYVQGKERLMYNYRTGILKYHGIDVSKIPSRHRIVLINKTRALRRSLRGIKNLDEIEQFLRLTYPEIPTDVIDWNKYTFTQQMHELYQTTILITPCGGISTIIPFLPDETHAIVMDFYVSEQAYLKTEPYKVGESGSMDAGFLNYFPHVRKLYYQIRSKNDYAFDFPGASNTRYDASIIVNTTRLRELIDTALYESPIEFRE